LAFKYKTYKFYKQRQREFFYEISSYFKRFKKLCVFKIVEHQKIAMPVLNIRKIRGVLNMVYSITNVSLKVQESSIEKKKDCILIKLLLIKTIIPYFYKPTLA
jgi:hypothetical protein